MLHAVLRLIAVFCVSFVSVWPLADLQQRATGALGEWLSGRAPSIRNRTSTHRVGAPG
jgi:hypothetical protein